ncbi:MAG: HYR domain-containing protein, partial [Flavobacteriales bacterium]|nr:HYR domain-containing protein [Flavobacteriales bacterium]
GIDNVGSIYTGGSYDLLSAFGATNLTTDAQNNGFVAKLNLCSLSIVCPANQTVTANASCQYTLLDYTVMTTPFASCGITSVNQIPIPGTVVNSGINPITVYLTDNSGNVDSCSFDVIVESAVNPTVVSCGDVLIGETTVGSGNNGGMFTCTGTPTPGEDVYYQVTVPTGNYLLGITLSNVIDASDTTVNVFWVGGSCPLGSGCLSSDNYNIVDQDFDSNGQNQLVFSAVGPGTYYFVVDSETDGIDSYDISFSCIVSGIEFGETNCGLDVDNDGLHVTVNGSTTLDVNPCETVSVCHTIYTQNIFGGEWLDTLSMNLGSCYTNITNMVPTSPGPNGFYDGGGEWTGVYDGPTNSIEWGFNYSGPQLWGDGFGGIGYNCRAYTFCFDAEISSTCTNNNLTVQLKIEDDGVNGAIAGASPGFDFATSNNFTISNPPPTITCPVNVVVNNDVGNCSAVVNGLTPVRNDNCPNPFVTYSIVGATTGSGVNDASGTTFNIGITTVQYMVTDSLGLQDSCSFTVTVVDNENPTITCPSNFNTNTAGCSQVVIGIAPTASGDNCVIDSVNFVLTGATTGSGLNDASGIAFNLGLTTVTYTVTDTSGNVTSCNFSINITDNVNPTISCPGNVNISNDVGSCSAVVNGIIPTPADNCAIDSVNYVLTGATIGSGLSDASGTIFNVGVTNVNYTVTDFFGNSSNCTFTVTVIDNEAPAISCPPNVNTNNDVGICGAIVNGIAPTIVSDNCVIDSVNYTLTGVTIGSGLNDVSGSVFNVGITTVIYTITDVSGNTSSCNFTVTVTDNEPPTFICPANTNEFVDINCDFSIPDYTGVIGLADNCTANLSIIVSQSPLIGTIISGHSTTQNITIYVTDIVGNIDSCIFIVTLVDTIKPTITCTGDTTEFFGNNCSFTLPNYSPISVGDNCTAAVAIVVTQLPTPGVIIFSDTLITLTANDGNGNIDTCTFMVLLSDTIDPIISCPNDTIVNNDLGLCDATITIGIPLNSDNCGIGSLLNDYNGGGDASDIYPVGLTTVVWTVIDNSLNITTCSFDVTVIDAEEPSITCVNDTMINTDNNSCDAVFNYTISAFDNCFFTISQISGLPSGATFPQGITTNTFVATDPSGLADTCSFLVTVIDNQNPTIVCPNDTILCNTNVTIPLPNLGDNCLVGNVVNDFNLTNNASGIYPVGITLINWTAFDASGNSNSCVMTVQVDLKPSIADAGEDQHILINQNTNLEALSPFVGVGLWSLISGNGVVDDNLNSLSMVSDLSIGDNIFRWTIVNGTCPDSFDEVNVIVGGLNVPNGFSPNGDGNNDLFVIPGIERMNNEVVIFNRWGVELYKTNNYQNDWNGDSNGGNTLPDDTYFYIIRLIDFSEEYSGYVVIKR